MRCELQLATRGSDELLADSAAYRRPPRLGSLRIERGVRGAARR